MNPVGLDHYLDTGDSINTAWRVTTWEQECYPVVKSLLPETRDAAVDVGAGNGRMVPVLRAWFKRVVAVDPFASLDPRFDIADKDYFKGTLAEFKPDILFDAAFCIGTFYILNWDNGMEHLCRILKPSGIIVIWDGQGRNGRNYDLDKLAAEHGRRVLAQKVTSSGSMVLTVIGPQEGGL